MGVLCWKKARGGGSVEITCKWEEERITMLEDLLTDVETKSIALEKQPSTRVQACQLLAKSKAYQKEVDEFELPDLEADYSDEEGERFDDALERYNAVRANLADTVAKAETLCVCWDN